MLGGVADTVAQLITAFQTRRTQTSGDDFLSIEIPDLDKEKPPTVGEWGYGRGLPPAFDFERLTRFMAYGFFMAPIQFQWFGFLSRAFPLTKMHPTAPAFKRVAFDQFIFAPFGMALNVLLLHSGMFVLTRCDRSCVLLHLHDDRRGWWQKSIDTEIPRCVLANSQGQFRAVAGSADPQLPCRPYSVPDCMSLAFAET